MRVFQETKVCGSFKEPSPITLPKNTGHVKRVYDSVFFFGGGEDTRIKFVTIYPTTYILFIICSLLELVIYIIFFLTKILSFRTCSLDSMVYNYGPNLLIEVGNENLDITIPKIIVVVTMLSGVFIEDFDTILNN